MPSETFAVLREPASEMDLRRASAAMAQVLGGLPMDHAQKLRETPGILAQGMSETQAQSFAGALGKQGIAAFVLAESQMAIPPPAEEIRDGSVEEEGLRYKGAQGVLLAPWHEILYLDCAVVRYEVKRKVQKFRTRPEGMGDYRMRWTNARHRVSQLVRMDDGRREQPQMQTESSWREVLEIVCYDPWAHLRIDRDNFRYALANMPLHQTNHLNFLALAAMIKARSEKAEFGPGIALLMDGKPATRSRAASMEAHLNLLLWRLQLMWR